MYSPQNMQEYVETCTQSYQKLGGPGPGPNNVSTYVQQFGKQSSRTGGLNSRKTSVPFTFLILDQSSCCEDSVTQVHINTVTPNTRLLERKITFIYVPITEIFGCSTLVWTDPNEIYNL